MTTTYPQLVDLSALEHELHEEADRNNREIEKATSSLEVLKDHQEEVMADLKSIARLRLFAKPAPAPAPGATSHPQPPAAVTKQHLIVDVIRARGGTAEARQILEGLYARGVYTDDNKCMTQLYAQLQQLRMKGLVKSFRDNGQVCYRLASLT